MERCSPMKEGNAKHFLAAAGRSESEAETTELPFTIFLATEISVTSFRLRLHSGPRHPNERDPDSAERNAPNGAVFHRAPLFTERTR